MATRPKVFEQEEIEARLRQQGVPESSIAPTISFMRLVIPVVIQSVGAERLLELLNKASAQWGLDKKPPGWRQTMAAYVVQWAENRVNEYETERFGPSGEDVTV